MWFSWYFYLVIALLVKCCSLLERTTMLIENGTGHYLYVLKLAGLNYRKYVTWTWGFPSRRFQISWRTQWHYVLMTYSARSSEDWFRNQWQINLANNSYPRDWWTFIGPSRNNRKVTHLWKNVLDILRKRSPSYCPYWHVVLVIPKRKRKS